LYAAPIMYGDNAKIALITRNNGNLYVKDVYGLSELSYKYSHLSDVFSIFRKVVEKIGIA